MALSTQERRQWRELERQLTPDVPIVAEPIKVDGIKVDGIKVDGIKHRITGMTGMVGSVLALGFVLLAFSVVILAVLVKVLLLGVLGFVLMILGGTRLRLPRRKRQPGQTTNPPSRGVV